MIAAIYSVGSSAQFIEQMSRSRERPSSLRMPPTGFPRIEEKEGLILLEVLRELTTMQMATMTQ